MHGYNLCLSFGMNQIYDDASFSLNDNDKVGVVGVNGAGKTTFFHVIMGDIKLDSGKIIYPKNKLIGYLPQEIVLEDDISVFDYLLTGRPIDKLNKKLTMLYEKAALMDENNSKYMKEISKTQELLEYYDCYEAENILLEIVSNMNISSELLDLNMKDLSGGQKSKIAFARLLYSKCSILLLDEPTNHLDVDTREYVSNYLKNYKGQVFVISHDVDFLNSIVNKILNIDKANKKINVFNGNYDDYLKKDMLNKLNEEKLVEKQNKEIEKLRNVVLKYSNSSGKRKRMAQDREKKLDKLLENSISLDEVNKKVDFKIKLLREDSKIVLNVNNLDFGYDKLLYKNLSFSINRGERFLIIGENGVGKTTLLKLINGILKPINGSISFGLRTDIGYYAQEQEILDFSKNVIENVNSNFYGESVLRSYLSHFLFFSDDIYKNINNLSPGERARLALLKVILTGSNLLLLDEPTNHLDPETQRIIASKLNTYEGTIILVSHNKDFVNQIGIDRVLILPSGKIMNYSDEILSKYYDLDSKKNS